MEPVKITFSDSTTVNAPVAVAYEKLVNPLEQVKWNTLYLAVDVDPPGEVKTGTVMTGTFKGTGKGRVTFQEVVKNRSFTHYSELKIFNLIYLGEFYHQYQVEAQGGQTKFTQTVTVEPRGLGKLLKNVLISNFKKRLPESFAEFKKYVETT